MEFVFGSYGMSPWMEGDLWITCTRVALQMLCMCYTSGGIDIDGVMCGCCVHGVVGDPCEQLVKQASQPNNPPCLLQHTHLNRYC